MQGGFALGVFCEEDLLALEELVEGQVELAEEVEEWGVLVDHVGEVDVGDAGHQGEWVAGFYLFVGVDYGLLFGGWGGLHPHEISVFGLI